MGAPAMGAPAMGNPVLFKMDDDDKKSRRTVQSKAVSKAPTQANDTKSQMAKAQEEAKTLEFSNDEITQKKAFVWVCGKNNEGELGLGKSEDKINLPTNVVQLQDFPIKQFACSNSHTVLMTTAGDIHVSGGTLHGKLGMEGIEKSSLNKFHVVTQIEDYKVKQVACSDYLTICTLDNGNVLTLGGTNLKDKANVPQDPNTADIVTELQGKGIVKVSCGDYHAAAIDENG